MKNNSKIINETFNLPGPWEKIEVVSVTELDVDGVDVSIRTAGRSSYTNIGIGYDGHRGNPIRRQNITPGDVSKFVHM